MYPGFNPLYPCLTLFPRTFLLFRQTAPTAAWKRHLLITSCPSSSVLSFVRRALTIPPCSLEIFLPHRYQCGLDVHVGRLRDSLSLSEAEQRHPALMNAIFLWACYLSRPGTLSQYEQLYLSRATVALGDSMQFSSKTVDVIQASSLLALYFLSSGRLLEGSYHASTAATLAVQCRLHQIGSEGQSVAFDGWETSFELPPPKDNIERGERIATFWQVYNLDRCASVMLRRPATLPDSDHPWASITTPWPQRIEDYENVGLWFRVTPRRRRLTFHIQGELDAGSGSPTIRAFFVQQSQSTTISGFSTGALRVKASALYEGANRLSSSWSPREWALLSTASRWRRPNANCVCLCTPRGQARSRRASSRKTSTRSSTASSGLRRRSSRCTRSGARSRTTSSR